MKKIISVLLAAIICAALLASCTKNADINFGKEYSPAKSQLDCLIQLNSKTIDVAVIDSVMASYYMNLDSTYSNTLTTIDNLYLLTEQFGIAARKGSALIYQVNKTLVELYNDGSLMTLAKDFGLDDIVCIDGNYTAEAPSDMSDWDYITGNGKVIIGYTLYAPIAFEENNKLTGFDIELARAVFAKLGVDVEFVEIVWDTKEASLNGKTIDCIWNGLTITDERKENMEISIPYLNNNQVAVIRKADADKYKTTDDMSKAIIGAEAGSAGEECVIVAQ